MTERENKLQEPFVFNHSKKDEVIVQPLPPVWCSSICRNSMNEMCIEHCAIKRDTSYFEPKPGLTLADMPRFPITEGMTKDEKFTSVTVYLAKVVDHLKGVEDGPNTTIIRRKNIYDSRSSTLLEDFKVEDVLSSVQEGNTPPENRTKREDSPDRSSKLDGQTG